MRGATVGNVWHDVTGVQPEPPVGVVFAAAAVALLTVLARSVWRVARNVVTIAHEGGHALVAVLVGRRLSGIRLHSDTSGVTLSRGRPSGPGMVATAFAGYVAPSLLGLGFAAMLAIGRITALLWVSMALLVALLTQIRNVYGVVSVLVTALVVFGVSWFTPAVVQAGFAYFFTWFLLFAGLRPVGELQRNRRRRRAIDSDADQLARLTGLPGLVWVLSFGVVAVTAMVIAGSWLVRYSDLVALLPG